uniref:Sulfotransferase n=1 Tax=Suricata suricatta TaxID=37032 RepID=A0A673UJJ2_SURSU
MENLKSTLFKFKGYYFSRLGLKLDLVENLEDFEIRDDDVFIVTYPKSGTIWFQQILSLIYSEEHRKRTGNRSTVDQVPFMEYNFRKKNIVKRPSPRLFVTHLPYYLFPSGMQNNKAKVGNGLWLLKDNCSFFIISFPFITLTLNPKDVLLIGSLWFDHIKGWYEHKSLFNIQFMIYEEMKKNFRGSIVKVCKYLGKELIDEDMDAVVTQAMFENMKSDPRANYDSIMEIVGIPTNGHFLRKGTIGDWKNHMTVEQNERFDKIFQREMKDFPLKFIWDMNEE